MSSVFVIVVADFGISLQDLPQADRARLLSELAAKVSPQPHNLSNSSSFIADIFLDVCTGRVRIIAASTLRVSNSRRAALALPVARVGSHRFHRTACCESRSSSSRAAITSASS